MEQLRSRQKIWAGTAWWQVADSTPLAREHLQAAHLGVITVPFTAASQQALCSAHLQR